MRKTFLVALIALLVLGVGGYFGLTLYVNHVARSEVNSALATLRGAGAEASVGEVRYDLFAGRFELHDLSLVGPAQGVLKIGSLVANGVAQREAGRVFAQTAEITDLTMDLPTVISAPGITRYQAPRVDMTALSFPAQAPVDGGPSQIALDFFRQITVARIDIPASTGTGSSGDGETRVTREETNGAIRLEGLADGRFATMTAEPSRLTITGAHDLNGHGSVGKVDVKGFDIAGMLILLDPEQRQASDQFITIHDSVTIDGADFAMGDGFSYRMARMSMKDVALRPSAIAMEELGAANEEFQKVDQTKPEVSPELAQAYRVLGATFDEGLRLGGLTLEGMEATAPGGIGFGVGSFAVGAIEGGRMENITLEKMTGKGPGGDTFAMARFHLAGLKAGTLLALIADAAEDPQNVARWPAPFFNTIEAIEIDKAEAPTKEGSPVDIDKFALTWTAEPDALPTRVSATLRMSGPPAALGVAGSALALPAGQAERVSVSMDLGAAWNEADDTVSFDPVYAEVSDAFSVSAKLTLSDVDDSVFSPQPDEALAGAAQVNLSALDITVTDAGLYDQKLEEAARDQGLKPDEIRQLFAGFADLLLGQTVADRPELGPAVQSFINFLQKPMSTLALRITPRAEPLPVMMIAETLKGDEPLAIVDELNIETLDKP